MSVAYSAKALAELRPFVDTGDVPEEARFVRKIGCPKTRQFEVLELGYTLMVREIATEANPSPGQYVGVLPMAKLLKAMATDVLKANDQTRPSAKIVILPVVRREPMPPKVAAKSVNLTVSGKRSVMDERPPKCAPEEREPSRKWNKARQKYQFKGEVTIADRMLVAEAVANGFPITKCPPHKYSVEIGQPDAGMGGIYSDQASRAKSRKQRIERHAERLKLRQAAQTETKISP